MKTKRCAVTAAATYGRKHFFPIFMNESEVRRYIHTEYDETSENIEVPPHERYFQKEKNRGDISEIYHENSKLCKHKISRISDSVNLFQQNKSMEFIIANQPRDYKNRPETELPNPSRLNASIGDVIMNRRSGDTFIQDELTLKELSTILHYSAGASADIETNNGMSKKLRTYPSAGGLYPIKIFTILPCPVGELQAGLYYYNPEDHSISLIAPLCNNKDVLHDIFIESNPDKIGGAILLLIGNFWRSKVKYGVRGYRYTLLEAGHIAQNVLLASEAAGLSSYPRGDTLDRRVDELCGLDGVDEGVVYAISVGHQKPENKE